MFFSLFIFFTPSQSRVRLDRDSLPCETLKSGSLKRGESAGVAEKGRFKDIDALAHRSNVPLQVFSGETTPILGIESSIGTEGLQDGLI
jgi:hypothetical protein